VDNRWRGIVLRPWTGDTYCLVTILPKDKAKAYATSHRFSVQSSAPECRSPGRGSAPAAATAAAKASKPNGKRLFADVSRGETLPGVGVDAQILPTIRLMTARRTWRRGRRRCLRRSTRRCTPWPAHDPGRGQGGGCQALRAGTTPDQVDTDDLVSAMERSRARSPLLPGMRSLRLILAHPFAAWRMFCTQASARSLTG